MCARGCSKIGDLIILLWSQDNRWASEIQKPWSAVEKFGTKTKKELGCSVASSSKRSTWQSYVIYSTFIEVWYVTLPSDVRERVSNWCKRCFAKTSSLFLRLVRSRQGSEVYRKQNVHGQDNCNNRKCHHHLNVPMNNEAERTKE